jgi:DNA segregation ATPase FtsK/SpoIIIE-like protein
MLSSSEYSNSKAILPMCIGANLSGVPVVADLESAPHILIAGNSLSGKSTVIYSMLVSMLLKKSPDQLRLVLAGSDKICFSEFEGLLHLRVLPVFIKKALPCSMMITVCFLKGFSR